MKALSAVHLDFLKEMFSKQVLQAGHSLLSAPRRNRRSGRRLRGTRLRNSQSVATQTHCRHQAEHPQLRDLTRHSVDSRDASRP